jgi:hypothetical protein
MAEHRRFRSQEIRKMLKPRRPSASLAIASASLFIALGGTSLAATGLIGTNQIKNGAITTPKIHNGAVTASKVAPNTFLPANGTAQNASALGNHPSGDFLLGRGGMFANRITVPAGQSQLLLGLGFGDLIGKCAAGGVPQIEYQSNVTSVNLVDWVTDYGSPSGTASIHTTNGLQKNGLYIESHNSVVPQSITWEAAFNDGSPHVATAWTSGQDIGGTSCIFIGQALATN